MPDEERGAAVERTLHTALFDRGWVDYVVTEVTNAPSYRGDGSVLVQRRGTLSFPVDVDLVRVDGSKERRRWDGAAGELRIAYHGDVPLRGAVVDPDHAVLLDADPTNNEALAADASPAAAPRMFERLLYWAELVAQAVVP